MEPCQIFTCIIPFEGWKREKKNNLMALLKIYFPSVDSISEKKRNEES